VGWEIWDNRGKQKTLVKSPWVVLSPAAGLLLGLFLRGFMGNSLGLGLPYKSFS